MLLQHLVMDVAALQNLAQYMAHLLADAEQADGTAFGSFDAAHDLQRPRALLDLEHLEAVAGLDVVGVGQKHAAFEPRGDLRHVVLEAPERADRRLGDDDILARQTGVEALADDAFEDEQAGGLVLLAGREDFLDPGAADDGLDDLPAELARHRTLRPVGQVIDDVVIAELDLVAVRDLARLRVRANVEADDRRTACA